MATLEVFVFFQRGKCGAWALKPMLYVNLKMDNFPIVFTSFAIDNMIAYTSSRLMNRHQNLIIRLSILASNVWKGCSKRSSFKIEDRP